METNAEILGRILNDLPSDTNTIRMFRIYDPTKGEAVFILCYDVATGNQNYPQHSSTKILTQAEFEALKTYFPEDTELTTYMTGYESKTTLDILLRKHIIDEILAELA